MAQKNVVVNLDINHADARQKVTELRKMMKDLEDQRSKLTDAGDTKGLIAVKKQISAVTSELKIQRQFAFDVNKVLANVNTSSYKDLKVALKLVSNELEFVRDDQQKVNDLMEKQVEIEKRMAEIRKSKNPASRSEKTMSRVKNIGAVLGLGTAIGFIKGKAKQAVDAFNEFDDKLADVRKTTQLSQEQVESLSLSLSKIDTRTSQNELLGLSYQAGKLGISAEKDVLKFVDAADKIGVALGDDLGGKEEAINTMGKLVDLFKIKDEYGMAEGMLKVGSAVNALGAASTANEGYIVDFASRTGGIGVSAKIAATDLMGLGATFDSLNAEVESSGTVINKVVVGMFSKTTEYAKVAKMGVKEFTQLLKTDANEALLRVLEGFNGQDLTYTASMLGEVGENGARAAQATALISKNIAMVRAQQAIANEEFIKGTGVIDEFDIKNNTAAAKREKAAKDVTEAMREIGRVLSPIYTSFLSGSASAIQVVGAAVKVFWEYKGVVISLTGAIIAYSNMARIKNIWDSLGVVATKLGVFWSKAHGVAIRRETVNMLTNSKAIKAGTATTTTYTLGQKALIAVKALLAGQFRAASAAAKSFWVSLGPIGWAITAFTAIAGAVALFGKNTDKASESAKKLNDVQSKVDGVNKSTEAFERKKKRLNELVGTYNELNKKTNRSSEDNINLQKTIDNIVQIMPNAASVFDAYGKAIDISTGKINKAIEAQRKFLMYKQRDIIDEAVEGAGDTMKDMQSTQSDIADKKQTLNVVGSQGYVMARGGKHKIKAEEGIVDLKFQYKQQQEIFYGYIKELERLSMSSVEIAARLSKETGILMTSEAVDAFKSQFGDIEEAMDEGLKCPTCGKFPCICKKDDGDKKKWSLESDAKFGAAKVALRKRLLDGQIATEKEYNDKLLALEISTLEARLSTGKLGNDEILKLEGDLADKRYTQQKQEQERIKKLQEVIDADKKPEEQEQIRYEKQLRDLGLFGLKREDMTKQQLDALVALEKTHTKKLSSIYMDSLNKEFEASQKQLSKEITALKEAQGVEISSIKTFADKKRILSLYYSAEELRQITTDKEADKALKAEYDRQELVKKQEHLNKELALYMAMSAEFTNYGTVFGEAITEEDAKKFEEIIERLKKQLADLGVEIQKTPENGSGGGVDIFGMTPDQWEDTFAKLKQGEASLDDWGKAIGAVGQAMASTFGEVSNLMTAIEQREFAKHEKMSKDEKKRLDKQLNAGVISQEVYNRKIQSLDDETEEKRIEMERKQAERQKAMAIFNALINTAVAVVSALEAGPILGPILAGVVGALGAVQIATIMAQPLPGAEDGGMLVERSQDGKRFNAEFDPAKRGRVDKPTVIVGENGSEYVVPAEGYENPTIRPVLDIIEMARNNGTLRSINLPQIQTATMFGRQGGGYVSQPSTSPIATPSPSNGDNYARFIVVLERTEAVLSKVDDKLSRPFPSYVTINGTNGLASQLDKYNKQKDNGRI